VQDQDVEKIIKLINRLPSEEINKQNTNGDTVLIFASYYRYVKIVKLLLKYKNIDVNIQDEFGKTALTIATKEEHIEIVKLLLSHKDIDVNMQNINGNTALICILLWAYRNSKFIIGTILTKKLIYN